MESCACGTTARPTTSLHNCSNFAQTPSFDPLDELASSGNAKSHGKCWNAKVGLGGGKLNNLAAPTDGKFYFLLTSTRRQRCRREFCKKKCLACCILIWDNLPLHRRPMRGGKFEYRRNFFVANLNAAIYTRNMCVFIQLHDRKSRKTI